MEEQHWDRLYQRLNLTNKPFLIAGPCVIESLDHSLFMAENLKKIAENHAIDFIFKSSFDKANRTKLKNYRGVGFKSSIEIFQKVKEEIGVDICTDFHEPWQANEIKNVVDIIQIPAFLCRQTDMLIAAAETNRIINIKKGQFISGYDTERIVNKVKESGNNKIFLTERGNTFGYGDYIVDFRNIQIMKKYSPVIFDVGHSLQKGCSGGSSGSHMEFAETYLRAALAVGVSGIFMEVHNYPKKALSDGTTSVKLNNLDVLLNRNKSLWKKEN
jgi:2-dehydro-3-deoxyphosphooctonate aldolase (KDO 8-P synthase)